MKTKMEKDENACAMMGKSRRNTAMMTKTIEKGNWTGTELGMMMTKTKRTDGRNSPRKSRKAQMRRNALIAMIALGPPEARACLDRLRP